MRAVIGDFARALAFKKRCKRKLSIRDRLICQHHMNMLPHRPKGRCLLLIPQLLLAHMLADYLLQTNWLIARKGQRWDGLALHGAMVFFMSILALAPYIKVVLVPILILSIVHTSQDWLKIYTGPRIKIHPFIPYMADQFSHYTQIIIMQLVVGSLLIPAPTHTDVIVATIAATVISLTRFYDITWWSNWLDMIPYMTRWRWWGYAERLAMCALSAIGLFFMAPLCILPRLIFSWQTKQPIWTQKRGMLEMGLGVVFAIALGVILRAMLLY
jgi:hypothetical protein